MIKAWNWIALAVLPLAAQESGNLTTVRKMQNELQQSMIRADTAALSNILTEDFVRTPPGGADTNKTEWISLIGSKRLKYLSTDNIEYKDRAYGNTALVSTVTNVRYIANGAERTVKLKVLWVWAKQAGQWKLAAIHGTEVAAR